MFGQLSPEALDAMQAEALANVKKRRVQKANPTWKPLPGPQTDAYSSEAFETFYGGQAGGGKTDLAVGLALTAHTQSIIFRRVYPSLASIVDRTIKIVGSDDGLNRNDHIWRGLPGGRTIEFGSLQLESDKRKHQGRPHDLYVFDECPEFSETQVEFVTAWARTTNPKQRVRVLLTGNPPTTASGEWVTRRYAAWLDPKYPHPAQPGELRWYAKIDDKEVECVDGTLFEHNGETIVPRSRTFIRAGLKDNPHLNHDLTYVGVLQSLPEPLRSQLLKGDFSAAVTEDPWQVFPTRWVQAAMERYRQSERNPNAICRAMGIDVARGGQDKTAIARLFGNRFELEATAGTQTPDGDSVATFALSLESDLSTPLAVDVIGVGAAAFDAVRRVGYQYATPINNGGKSETRDKTGRYAFTNLRAESHWRLREALDPASGEDIELPDNRELLADLCAVRFKVVGAKYQIEDKDDIKKRIGRSPDLGDAIVMTWHRANETDVLIGFA